MHKYKIVVNPNYLINAARCDKAENSPSPHAVFNSTCDTESTMRCDKVWEPRPAGTQDAPGGMFAGWFTPTDPHHCRCACVNASEGASARARFAGEPTRHTQCTTCTEQVATFPPNKLSASRLSSRNTSKKYEQNNEIFWIIPPGIESNVNPYINLVGQLNENIILSSSFFICCMFIIFSLPN